MKDGTKLVFINYYDFLNWVLIDMYIILTLSIISDCAMQYLSSLDEVDTRWLENSTLKVVHSQKRFVKNVQLFKKQLHKYKSRNN